MSGFNNIDLSYDDPESPDPVDTDPRDEEFLDINSSDLIQNAGSPAKSGHNFEYSSRFAQQKEIEVKIVDTRLEKNSMLDSYYKFKFEIYFQNAQTKSFERRFSDFELLYSYLTKKNLGLVIPHLPPKHL
jgi:hypothetical protein